MTDFQHILRGNLSHLLNLSLSHNEIEEVPGKTFRNFSNLQILNLDHNNVRKIWPGAFEGLAKLRRLVLDHNGLTLLASGTFRGLISLTYLGLRHNKLASWDGTFYEEMLNLIHLDITGNDGFRFGFMSLPTTETALKKIYGLNAISKTCKVCPELTRANVSRKKVLPRRTCQYTPTQYLPMLDEYQARGVLLKGNCGTKKCELMLTDVDPLRKIYKDKCWATIRKIRAIEYVLGLVAIIINLIVIVGTLKSKYLRAKTSFLLVCHLAFCDLLMGCFFIMIATGHAIDHDPTFRRWRADVCPYYRTVFVLSQTMGAATSILVTIERYLAIVYAMNPALRITPLIAAIFLACSWVFAAIMATVIQVIDNRLLAIRDNAMCVLAQNLVHIAGRSQKLLCNQGLLISLVFLYFFVIGLYVHLYLVVRKAAVNAGVRREGKLAKRIGTIVISNLLFFVMPNLAIFVFTAAMVDVSVDQPILNAMVKIWLPPVCMLINACLDPLLFAFRNELFINALKSLVRGRQSQVAPVVRARMEITNDSTGDPSFGITRSCTPLASIEKNTAS